MSWESSQFPQPIHLQGRRLSTIRPAGLWVTGWQPPSPGPYTGLSGGTHGTCLYTQRSQLPCSVSGGRSIRRGDPSFSFWKYAAPAGCALDDEQTPKVANPALDDFLHRDALRATLPQDARGRVSPLPLGQWVAVEDAWLPDGAWQACADPMDRSFPRDCTPWSPPP
jgi:hypothetical protein